MEAALGALAQQVKEMQARIATVKSTAASAASAVVLPPPATASLPAAPLQQLQFSAAPAAPKSKAAGKAR
jgi:hypothetical protein